MWIANATLYGNIGFIVLILLGGVINCLFYGCIAMLISKKGL
jgi:hypothetical protein